MPFENGAPLRGCLPVPSRLTPEEQVRSASFKGSPKADDMFYADTG